MPPALSVLTALTTDVAAIGALAYWLYFRRYHRRDLLLAYVAMNTGVFAVTIALSGAQAGIGLGLGLFGILSIIRLRSDQITQEEIGYYFVALALGLVNGLQSAAAWVAPAVSLALVAVIDAVFRGADASAGDDGRQPAETVHRARIAGVRPGPVDRAVDPCRARQDELGTRS